MKRLLMILLPLLLCVPAAMAQSPDCWIDGGNADRVHLRVEPSIEADSMGLYYTGTDVIVIGYEADWAWVMVGDEDGYIMMAYLTWEGAVPLGPWQVVDNPDSTWVNLRMKPSTQGAILSCPDNGTMVRVLGETADGWSYVLCQGVKGYIMTSLLSPRYEATSSQLQRTTILAQIGAGEEYIHQYIAPNGQALYFTAARQDPDISFEDVNFDGWDDIVIMTTSGASNAYYDFYVYDAAADEYCRVSVAGEENGWCNYSFYPEYGIVATHANNGSAGANHEYRLYRWQGTKLDCIRTARSEVLTESTHSGSVFTMTTYTDKLHMTVRDHTLGDWDDALVGEKIITMSEDEYRAAYEEEMSALWQGVR